ncbi:MAG: hypothetical protein IJ060_02435 [Oscillospiraceae bacterium]|nr:hypothetical protein [Oscillospiraceae bacterium]
MDFLVELIMEVIGGIWEEAVNSPGIPKVVRTVLILLLGIPLCGFLWVLAFGILLDRRYAAGAVTGVIALLLTGTFAFLVWRVWRRKT